MQDQTCANQNNPNRKLYSGSFLNWNALHFSIIEFELISVSLKKYLLWLSWLNISNIAKALIMSKINLNLTLYVSHTDIYNHVKIAREPVSLCVLQNLVRVKFYNQNHNQEILNWHSRKFHSRIWKIQKASCKDFWKSGFAPPVIPARSRVLA